MSIAVPNENTFLASLRSGINLFAGAGFSVLASDRNGRTLPIGTSLKEELADFFDQTQLNAIELPQAYAVLNSKFSNELRRFLNERFVLNEKERQPHKVRVKDTIDLLLIKNSAMNLEGLIKALEKESIQTVLRQNNQIKSKKNENQIINVYSFQLKSFTFYCLHKHWLFEPLSMQGTIICYRQMEGGIG